MSSIDDLCESIASISTKSREEEYVLLVDTYNKFETITEQEITPFITELYYLLKRYYYYFIKNIHTYKKMYENMFVIQHNTEDFLWIYENPEKVIISNTLMLSKAKVILKEIIYDIHMKSDEEMSEDDGVSDEGDPEGYAEGYSEGGTEGDYEGFSKQDMYDSE